MRIGGKGFACVTAALVGAVAGPAAAKNCSFGWAVPGVYEITGNFRGQVESTTFRVTGDCKLSVQLPGVFVGGALARAGQCLRFSFKVQDKPGVLHGRWCAGSAVIPWKKKEVRASVKLKTRSAEETQPKFNFNN